jgi:hypothetical protein
MEEPTLRGRGGLLDDGAVVVAVFTVVREDKRRPHRYRHGNSSIDILNAQSGHLWPLVCVHLRLIDDRKVVSSGLAVCVSACRTWVNAVQGWRKQGCRHRLRSTGSFTP